MSPSSFSTTTILNQPWFIKQKSISILCLSEILVLQEPKEAHILSKVLMWFMFKFSDLLLYVIHQIQSLPL